MKRNHWSTWRLAATFTATIFASALAAACGAAGDDAGDDDALAAAPAGHYGKAGDGNVECSACHAAWSMEFRALGGDGHDGPPGGDNIECSACHVAPAPGGPRGAALGEYAAGEAVGDCSLVADALYVDDACRERADISAVVSELGCLALCDLGPGAATHALDDGTCRSLTLEERVVPSGWGACTWNAADISE